METFFKEIEVKKFTQNEKLRFIFNQLLTWLQPVETKRKKNYTWEGTYPFPKKRYWTIIFNSCNFKNIKCIENPFPDIQLKITKQMITITGSNYEYQFAPDQILTIWNRLQKATK
jgi:hypothetical protein